MLIWSGAVCEGPPVCLVCFVGAPRGGVFVGGVRAGSCCGVVWGAVNGVEVVDVDMARGKCVEGIHRPSLLRATMNSRDTR